MIPYGCQWISEADKAAVLATLESDFLTQGPAVPQFEQAVAGYCDVPHAVAVSNGTAALHLACLALDIGPGDQVWTSPTTFVASANCARYCGASVDFVDIDPLTLNLSPTRLAAKLAAARESGNLPKAVVVVHFGGRPCNMDAIAGLAREYGIALIEDAAHALGAQYVGTNGARVGNGEFSAITCMSFHPVKIITTGEGGLLTTRDARLAERIRLLRSHGITRDAAQMSSPSRFDEEGPWYYEQVALGFNYRLTDIQAALGASQMRRLDAFVERRRHLARRYAEKLAGSGIVLPAASEDSAWHLYPVRVDAGRRRRVFDALRLADIGVNVHYIPVHLQPDFRKQGFFAGQFPESERYYAETISLPLHPRLTDAEQDYIVATLKTALA